MGKININKVKKKIYKLGVKNIEYLKIYDIGKFTINKKSKIKTRIFISYYLKSVRLIDNI